MSNLAASWPEQVLCKENKRKAIAAQREKWMAQRANEMQLEQQRLQNLEGSDEDELESINGFLELIGESLAISSPPKEYQRDRKLGERSSHELTIGELKEPLDPEDRDLPQELRGAEFGRLLRTQARPACRAWHSALRIPEPTLLVDLQSDCARLVLEGSRTQWLDEFDSPACALEQLALSILRSHRPSLQAKGMAPCGVEWWVQHRRSNSARPSIGLHWDTDEEWKAKTGEHVPPFLSTVTYLGGCGAPTLILPLAADAHGRGVRPPSSSNCGAFVSYPRAGKHIAFDGRLLHGAPHELAACTALEEERHSTAPHRPSDGAPYVRTTILANIWCGHRPAGRERLSTALAKRLTPVKASLELTLSEDKAERASVVEEPAHDDVHFEAAAVGYPFYHPAVSAHGLPSPHQAAAQRHSFVHVPRSRLALCIAGEMSNI